MANRWPQYSRGCATRIKQIDEDGKTGSPDMTYPNSQATLLREIGEARKQGKTPLSGEHIFNVLKQPILHAMHRASSIPITHFGHNPTHIPDEIWQTLRPIIVIRHPVPHINSGYAALSTLGMSVTVGDEDLGIFCSQRYYRYVEPLLPHYVYKTGRVQAAHVWRLCAVVSPLKLDDHPSLTYTSHLFDLLRSQNRAPLVIDADDLLFQTDRVTRALSDTLNLDASLLSEHWDVMPEEQRPKDPIMRAWMATFHASTGIERPEKEDEKDVEVAFGRWKQKWGEDVAECLKELAEENLMHYEYLARFKA
ncbi:uncharacterized protein N0V89_006707 [Didymosphaeria variabile]|uniref:Uncharacterized protein n=1 Tax=Didymosphaeria variabile TaxID=1932322 RepID=A0A9W8XI60_9PLEO|nr:uncharacterized protein N0V89_006707 [Didymosphaeria variabile]KAJ4351367.1 hypothetical protein N0V89_006707 [Didymosphaeria variabile]